MHPQCWQAEPRRIDAAGLLSPASAELARTQSEVIEIEMQAMSPNGPTNNKGRGIKKHRLLHSKVVLRASGGFIEDPQEGKGSGRRSWGAPNIWPREGQHLYHGRRNTFGAELREANSGQCLLPPAFGECPDAPIIHCLPWGRGAKSVFEGVPRASISHRARAKDRKGRQGAHGAGRALTPTSRQRRNMR